MDQDKIELDRFKRIVKEANAHQVDRDIQYNKEFNMHAVYMYDPYQVTIINEFNFIKEATAKQAVEHLKTFE